MNRVKPDVAPEPIEGFLDLLVLVRDHLDKMSEIGSDADLNGDAKQLAQFVTTEFTYIFFSIFQKPISENYHLLAALTRSAQELIADFSYVISYKSQDKVSKYLYRIMFAEHRRVEYFVAMQGEFGFNRVCKPPKWSDTTQTQRINSQLGLEEEIFYGLLCAYTHFTAGNHAFYAHEGTQGLLRNYCFAKLAKYSYQLAELRINHNLFTSDSMKSEVINFVKNMDDIVKDWGAYLSNLYTVADLSNEH